MENLFLSAMQSTDLDALNSIKANKEFALTLNKHLEGVYSTFPEVKDYNDSVAITLRKFERHNESFRFFANKDGVIFTGKVLGYRNAKTVQSLGEMYEKYKNDGTTAENAFLLTERGHGFVNFSIKLEKDSIELNDKLRDIMWLLNFSSFNKKF